MADDPIDDPIDEPATPEPPARVEVRREPVLPPRPQAPAPAKPGPKPADDGLDGLSPEELRAEVIRAKKEKAEINRKAMADRRELDEMREKERLAEEAKLSEVDRYKRQLSDAEARREAAERRAESESASRVRLSIGHAIERAAIDLGFEYPDIVPATLANDFPDLIEPDEEGNLPAARVKEAVKKLAERRPRMLTTHRGGGSPAAIAARRPVVGAAPTPGGKGTPDPIEERLRQSQRYRLG